MIETNEIIETQMNYATIQTEAVNSTWYLNGYNGNTNSSIAILDTGVDPNHPFFPDGFESTNLNGNIVGQENLINESSAFDDHGHGTFITSIISGTGTEPYNSSSPTNINLYGNYSHLELFDSLSPKNYSVKIFTFNVSKINSHIFINSSWNLQVSGIDGFWFELYNGTTLVNNSLNMTFNKYYTINHSISKSGQGIYDLYVKYHKKIEKKPIFSFNSSISFYPEFYVNNYTYFTGIANATKIVAYKILNQTGIGYASDLISALASVIQNKSKYHIISVCLSIGTLGEDVAAINAVINEVINNGTLVVIAAGNSGIKGSDPLNKLALNKNAIIVGAINDDDQVTSYSSMGRSIGNGVIKPDIVAPGGSKLPGHRLIIGADAISNKTTAAYGTSIASAIVSAAINILIEAKCGNWTEWNKLNLTNWVKTIKSILL
ncbi:MAG: S8 family serine peptidase, partial [Promethearchaeota archaeon]